MSKRNKRSRETGGAERPTVIDAVAHEISSSESSPASTSLPTTSPAPSAPLYGCTVSVFDDKIEISPSTPTQGTTKSTRWFGHRAATFFPATKGMPLLLACTAGGQALRADVKGWSNKWLARLGAFSLWLIFTSYLFQEEGLIGRLLSSIRQDPTWEPYVLVVLVAALLLLLPRRGLASAMLASLYVAFFPLVAIVVIMIKLFGGIILFKRLTTGLGRFTYRGANWLLMIACCAAVVKSTSATIVIISMAYLSLGTIYLVLSNFLWVTKPLSTVFALLEWLDSHSSTQLAKFKVEFGASFSQYRSSRDSKNSKTLMSAHQTVVTKLDTAKAWHWIADLVQGKLRRAVAPVVLFYLFAARFLASVALIAVVYASVYLGLSKIGVGGFAGRGLRDFSDALYFSVVTFCTVGYGDITPISGFAQWIVVAQMGTGLLMLTLLALSFSTLSNQTTTVAAEHMESNAKKFIEELTGILKQYVRVEGRSLPSVIDEVKRNPNSGLLR